MYIKSKAEATERKGQGLRAESGVMSGRVLGNELEISKEQVELRAGWRFGEEQVVRREAMGEAQAADEHNARRFYGPGNRGQ